MPTVYSFDGYSRPLLLNLQELSAGSSWHKRWNAGTFGSLNTSYGFSNAGSLTVLSAPIGVQLTRHLNKNWFAYAGLSAAPALFSFSNSLLDPAFGKTYPGNMLNNINRFGVYSGAEAGFLYINDEKTFSISGSVRMGNTSYPYFPTYGTGTNGHPPVGHSFK